MGSPKSVIYKICFLVILFIVCTFSLVYLSWQTSEILISEALLQANETLSFPRTIEDLKKLSSLFKAASISKHSDFVIFLYSAAFIYKQTFAIPGSVLLNLLAGSLFGLYKGLFLCATLTTMGALCCFLLSKFCGEPVVNLFLGNRLTEFRKRVENRSTFSLLSLLISMRLFPASPNWAINLLSPIVGVPWYHFAISCYVGLIPYIYLCVQTGQMLNEITSTHDIFTPSFAIKSTAVCLAALLPNLFLKPSANNDSNNGEVAKIVPAKKQTDKQNSNESAKKEPATKKAPKKESVAKSSPDRKMHKKVLSLKELPKKVAKREAKRRAISST